MPSCIKYNISAYYSYVIEHVLLIWYMLHRMRLEDRFDWLLTIRMHNPRNSFVAYEEHWLKFGIKIHSHSLEKNTNKRTRDRDVEISRKMQSLEEIILCVCAMSRHKFLCAKYKRDKKTNGVSNKYRTSQKSVSDKLRMHMEELRTHHGINDYLSCRQFDHNYNLRNKEFGNSRYIIVFPLSQSLIATCGAQYDKRSVIRRIRFPFLIRMFTWRLSRSVLERDIWDHFLSSQSSCELYLWWSQMIATDGFICYIQCKVLWNLQSFNLLLGWREDYLLDKIILSLLIILT